MVRARKTRCARPGGALILGSMFRLAAALTLAVATALAAAQAPAWAQGKPGCERG
jgi:hypothetical protein